MLPDCDLRILLSVISLHIFLLTVSLRILNLQRFHLCKDKYVVYHVIIKYLSKVTAEMPSWKLLSFLGQVPVFPVYRIRQTDSAVNSPYPAWGEITHPSDRCGRLGGQDAAAHFLCC